MAKFQRERRTQAEWRHNKMLKFAHKYFELKSKGDRVTKFTRKIESKKIVCDHDLSCLQKLD